MPNTKDFILASGSPQRKALLENIGYIPKAVITADIDETPNKYEKPTAYVKRMALEKAQAVSSKNPNENILAADTILAIGTHIVQKAKDAEEQAQVMRMMSGKAHKVLTAVCLIGKTGKISLRLNSNKVIVKKMTEAEIQEYIATNEWVGSAGYKIEGAAQFTVKKIIGSYSGIVGLPLYETKNMLVGVGIK